MDCYSYKKINLIKSLTDVDANHKWWRDLKDVLSNGKDDDAMGMLKNAKVTKVFDRKGNSVLHYVSLWTDNHRIAKYLASIGCNINHKNNAGIPSIAVAVASNSVNVTKQLLREGADRKNSDFSLDFGLLHIAIVAGSRDVAKVLIESGIDINAPDEDGCTPLQLAIAYYIYGRCPHSYAFIEMLINAGAEVNVKSNKNNLIPLHEACIEGSVDLIKLLLKAGADVNMRDANNNTSLFWAVKNKCTEAVKILIEAGTDINTTDDSGNTCLHYAAGTLNHEITQILLENGAKIDVTNEEAFTPLLYAIHQCLEDSMFDIPSNEDYDDHIQHHYPERELENQIKVLKLLLKYGADLNYWTANDFSPPLEPPIYESFTCAHSRVIQVLLRYNPVFDFNGSGSQFVINLPNRSKSLHELMKYTALCKAQDKKDSNLLNFDEKHLRPDLQQDYARCRDELELMKQSCIWGTRVVYFNLLINKDIRYLTCNENVVHDFESSKLTRKFPIYCDMLIKRFSKARRRQVLYDSAMKAFGNLVGYDENSYNVIFNKIASYLDKKDLQNLNKV